MTTNELKKEAKRYHKEKLAIFPSEMPSSWQMTDIIGKHFYNLALKGVMNELEKEVDKMYYGPKEDVTVTKCLLALKRLANYVEGQIKNLQ